MNVNQMHLLLKMKKLVREKKRRFINRKDRDYLKDIALLGLSIEEAWDVVLRLNKNDYFPDEKPVYKRHLNTLVFKRKINLKMVYIKLELVANENGEETVCWSFHESVK